MKSKIWCFVGVWDLLGIQILCSADRVPFSSFFVPFHGGNRRGFLGIYIILIYTFLSLFIYELKIFYS